MVERTGQQLGNYRLLSLLGQGGFAEVYLGEQVFLKKSVAIKLLYTQLEKVDLEGFLKEAQTIAHLEHRHIVRVTDFGLDGDLPYLVMEYAPNGTLRQRHPRGTTLPLPVISAYVKQVADALQYAHDEKLVHRDIKPENMLLNRNNELLLSDFGLATVAHRTATQNTQTIAGTAIYMAPELFRGKSYPASDQYALGIVVYEWLSGQPPFNEGDFIQLGFQHSYEQPEPLSEKNPAIPKDVEHVVMTALAKDPKQRFGSVKAFANALEQACIVAAAVQREKEAASVPPPVLSVQAKEVARPPSLQKKSTLPPSLPLPPVQLPTQSMPPLKNSSLSPTTAQSTPQIIETQSGLYGQLIHTQHAPRHKVTQRTKEPSPLPRSLQREHGISRRTALIGLSVIGLAVVGGGITWFVDSRKQGTWLYTYTGHSAGVASVAWSPDGQRIASGSFDKTVQVWQAV